HSVNHELRDYLVDPATGNYLAQILAGFDLLSHAGVVRLRAPLPYPITDRHPATATTTQQHSLEQSDALSGRALTTIATVCIVVVAQPGEIRLVVLPGDVCGVGVREEDLPLVSAHTPITPFAVRTLSRAGAPKHVRPSVAG